MSRSFGRRVCGLLVAAGLGGCALGPSPLPADGPRITSTIELAGTPRTVHWHRPDVPARATALLQHGFSRHCDNLRTMGRAIAVQGLLVLCVQLPMAGGAPHLAEALADALARGLPGPDGEPLPPRVVAIGHSAGALFAAHLAARLAQHAQPHAAGVILVDPVDGADLQRDLLQLAASGARRVLALTANPGPCNAGQAATPTLRHVSQRLAQTHGDGFIGWQLTDRSTHVDIEGTDTSWLAVAACAQGQPLPANAAALHDAVAQWARQLAAGEPASDTPPPVPVRAAGATTPR
jgi:pimeloyl-ACP methyl ester carboxylesterase